LLFCISFMIRNIQNNRNNRRNIRSPRMIPTIFGKMANKSVMAIGLIMYFILPLRLWYFCKLPQT
jgi:hypothetical protein